jgi:LacI family transcriptional regulator
MQLSIADERLKGYKKALDDHGLSIDQEFIRYCSYTDRSRLKEDIRAAIKQLMQSAKPPNAIFAAGDQITTSSVGIINQLGYRIPDDLALIGFTNTDLAGSLNPPLSTVYQPAYEIGQLAAEKLLGLIKGRRLFEDFETIRLETRINIRASSRPAPDLKY